MGTSADEQWRNFFLKARPAAMERHFLHRLPHDPRCALCNVPFAGPIAPFLRAIGYRRFERNPRYCTRCYRAINERRNGGAEIELSMLFADVRGSTPLAERMTTAEFRGLMDRFYAAGTKVLIDSDALVERFMGDQVIGHFIPLFAGPRHAAKAIEAARALLVATGHGGEDEPWIPVGAGVHTGIAWVGAIGNPGQMTEFTALGDAVNVAARLAASAAAGEILVSEASAAAAGLPADEGEARVIEVKGKAARLDVRALRVEAPRTAAAR